MGLFGQTINIMTLSGLALAIGILVDESTVTIENIHQHLDMGKPKRLAIWDACKEIAFPKLLILFCILAVFAPAFTMGGIPGSLFLPLALAIGFSMIASYFLAQTFVPVMANWIMKVHKEKTPAFVHPAVGPEGDSAAPARGEEKERLLLQPHGTDGRMTRFDTIRARFLRFIDRMMPWRKPIVVAYLVLTAGAAFLLLQHIGKDVLPKVNAGQFQVRIRAPEGTRIERTEEKTLSTIAIIKNIVGPKNVAITSAYIGQHPSLFCTDEPYLSVDGYCPQRRQCCRWRLTSITKTNLDDYKEKIRAQVGDKMPDVRLSFEPIELTDKILSQGIAYARGSARFSGRIKKNNEIYAQMLTVEKLRQIPYLRDVQLGQSNKYPAINIEVDRVRAAQLGVTMDDVSRSLVASTSSSRYTEKNIWKDEKGNNSYNVQVEVPENKMKSVGDIGEIPLLKNANRPVLGDVATIKEDTTYGENDNLGAIPVPSGLPRLIQ